MSKYMRAIIACHQAAVEFELIGCWATSQVFKKDLEALIAEAIEAKDPEVLDMFKGEPRALLSGRVAAA